MSNLLQKIRSQKIDWLKTLVINFKCLPFSQARHLPIHIYSGTIIGSYGNVVIKADEIRPGMIKIGRRLFFNGFKTFWENAGTIEFDGRNLIEAGANVNNMGGYIKFASDSRIGEGCKLLCMRQIEIGCFTQIPFGTVIMDTDFHTVIDTKEKKVRRPCMPVKIGDYNWIGNCCHIMKGTVTPDYAIVTAKSLLNKDYSQFPLYSVFGGTPAKWLADGKRRVYNKASASAISTLLAADENAKSVVLPQDVTDWDTFCQGGDEILFSD